MYTQFFGNYLLNNRYITSEQLISALEVQHDCSMKLGILAIQAGYMTSSQVETVHISQTHDNKMFGEICIEKGYLTQEQVDELLGSQTPDYMLFCQALDDLGYLKTSEFEEAFRDYKKKYLLSKNDFEHMENDKLIELIHSYNNIPEDTLSNFFAQYLSVLFNNIIRFIGKDFTPHPAKKLDNFPDGHRSHQKIIGAFPTISFYVSDTDTAIQFASRYAQEEFSDIDEFVEASVEDFLNLHNGLFITTMSNEFSIELFLEPPCTNAILELDNEKDYYEIPITFSFGTVHFIVERTRTEKAG